MVEFAVSSPVLRDARDAVPDMEFETEDVRQTSEEGQKYVFWASGDDFDAFEAALDEEPTAADYNLLVNLCDRRLYRVTLSPAAPERTTHETAARYDITFLDVTADATESQIRARVPDREALLAYRDAFRENNLPFRLIGIYDRAGENADADQFGITAPQREALVRALEAGYFDVPRRITLAKLAADLGISDQALSARLRRGQTNLVQNALDGESDADAGTERVGPPTKSDSRRASIANAWQRPATGGVRQTAKSGTNRFPTKRRARPSSRPSPRCRERRCPA
ncbi:helix-turn-helix domain-containing protein [Halorussus ruber]|uniref:helix-turn-helix domain-containing protein n=1 Tax=Halorussus ruber TaxID=1126238 RepID=UPI001B2FFD1B|nr:helix-turn-helix domain-containing protein [Halorussus ruber]